MGNLRVSNEVILAKIETTYNTDAVPVAATNAMLVQNVDFAAAGLRMQDRPAIRANIGQLQQLFGGQLGKLSFDVEVKGSGTAGTAPELGPLLRGCAMGETVVGGTSVTYKPISTTHESLTIYWFEGGRKRHILTGARGTWTLKLAAGGIAVLSFEMTGHYSEPTDQTQPTPTYNAQVPKTALGLTLTVGGVAIVTRELAVMAQNQVVMPPSLAAADGYSEVQITSRNIDGTLTMESELASVIDVDTQLKAGTASTLACGTVGSTAGNRFAANSATNGLVWSDRKVSEGEGLRLRQMPFNLIESATGNDEIALVFT